MWLISLQEEVTHLGEGPWMEGCCYDDDDDTWAAVSQRATHPGMEEKRGGEEGSSLERSLSKGAVGVFSPMLR